MPGWSLERILEMEPQDFENLIAHLFRQMGYRAEVTQQSRDGGVDVDVCLEHFGLSHRWAVQAKRYSGVVGVKEVREYSSIRYRDSVDGVIIVTTGSFTKEAQKEAAEHNVKLIEGALLTKMLDHYCPDGADKGSVAEKLSVSRQKKSIDGAILKRGEDTFASEQVMIGNQKLTMVITNKNIFLKKDGGLFSRNSEISRRIPLKDIIGIYTEDKRIFLVIGPKEMEITSIRIKNKSQLPAIFEQLRADYMKGEYLLKFKWSGEKFLLLTNKRLTEIDPRNETRDEIKIKDIVGIEISGAGFFKKKKLMISQSREGMQRREIDVDEPNDWKMEIEKAVRIA